MFGAKMGLHIIQFPSKRWGYVGAIPVTLGKEVPATTSDVLGCRSHRNAAGELCAWKFPSFDTCAEAIAHADANGCEISQRDELVA